MKKPLIVTITGIRPDFIRMAAVFRKLDERAEHVMIHTGQHYDDALSSVFFRDLEIRKPDFVLSSGRASATQYENLAYLAAEVPALLAREKLDPRWIVFLGDSNSALASVPLFKEGYRIAHIEGGMRSYDRRMPEEVNRVCCDYVSDLIFAYTPLYKQRLLGEGKRDENVQVVGNTITEIVRSHLPTEPRQRAGIVADIHRSENLSSAAQFRHVLEFLQAVGERLDQPVRLVRFARAQRLIDAHGLLDGLDRIELAGPFGFVEYLRLQYHAAVIVSDSGTAQEEGPLLGVPVVVPRNATERPESVEHGNSILVGETGPVARMVDDTMRFLDSYRWTPQSVEWLGDGSTSQSIVNGLVRD
jgi:UDP-N-acetylglucosamine 2-epimerase (non-hydrolysing)